MEERHFDRVLDDYHKTLGYTDEDDNTYYTYWEDHGIYESE